MRPTRIVAVNSPHEPMVSPIVARILSCAAEVEGCWVWLGVLDRHGYGRVKGERRVMLAHRASYEAFVGPIPEGLVIDHLCRNRACVNPDHLEAVTLAENKRRGESFAARNARKTHCSAGHRYDAENTHVTKDGYRVCRACRRAYAARRYANPEIRRLIRAQQRAAYARQRAAA